MCRTPELICMRSTQWSTNKEGKPFIEKQKPTETVEQPVTHFRGSMCHPTLMRLRELKGRHHTDDHMKRTTVFRSVTESDGETPALRK